jgi:hypothetical protein
MYSAIEYTGAVQCTVQCKAPEFYFFVDNKINRNGVICIFYLSVHFLMAKIDQFFTVYYSLCHQEFGFF